MLTFAFGGVNIAIVININKRVLLKGVTKMTHDKFAKWLKVVIIGVIIIGITCCAYILPQMCGIFADKYPEMKSWILPWCIVIYICAIPCFVAMIVSWMIASNIEKDNSFCMANAKLFKIFSMLALGDSIFLFVALMILWVLGFNHPGLMLIELLIVFCGLAIFICTSALSYFVAKAASLQEENDLTI